MIENNNDMNFLTNDCNDHWRFDDISFEYDMSQLSDIEFDHGVSYNVLIERALMCSSMVRVVESPNLFELQALYEDDVNSPSYKNFQCFKKYFAKASRYYQKTISEFMDIDTFEECCDKLAHLYGWYTKCKDPDDYVRLTMLAYQFVTGRFAHRDLFNYVSRKYFASDLQAGGTHEFLKFLRSGFNKFQTAQNSEVYKKLTAMYSYLLVHGILERFGLKINDEDYTKIEQKALYLNYSSKKEMWICILDTTLFICEKLYEFKVSGDVSVFIHSSDEYTKWLKEADRLLALAAFTSNLQAHGTTYFSYVSDLNHCIEQGEAYTKYTIANSGIDCVAMKRKLFSLQLLKNINITRRAAQEERAAPHGILVHGRSSVAKSSFAKLLFYYYTSLHGLENDDHYRYVRNPTDPYWTGCDSSVVTIQLDDIAFVLPNKIGEMDPTLGELICISNNVPFVAPQAAIEDKGKTPIRCEQLIATTNAIDLNAQAYFWCPLAVQRRLPFVIDVRPKDEYKHNNQVFIDPTKLIVEEGNYPDYWIITQYSIEPYFDGTRDKAVLKEVKQYDNINEFLKVYGEATIAHKKSQNNAQKCDKNMKDIKVCPLCLYTTKLCKCTLQADNDTIYHKVVKSIYACFIYIIQKVLTLCISIKWFYKFQMYCAKYKLFRYFMIKCIFKFYPTQMQMKLLGAYNNFQSSQTKWKKFIAVFGLFVVIATLAYKLYNSSLYTKKDTRRSTTKKSAEISKGVTTEETNETEYVSEEDTDEESDTYFNNMVIFSKHTRTTLSGQTLKSIDPMDIQGNMYCTVESQLEKEDRQNVWYNDHVELTKFDLPVTSQSLVGKSDEELANAFYKNCVFLDIQGHGSNAYKTMKIGGIFVYGHFCITNNHAFRDNCDTYTVKLVMSSVVSGLNSNVEFEIRPHSIIRNPNKDFCLFEVSAIPPMKDILKFWIEKPLNCATLLMLKRDKNGTVNNHSVYNAQLIQNFPVEVLGIKLPIMLGRVLESTAKGDCGAMALAKTPMGVTITGMHMLGYENQCGVSVILKEEIESCITTYKRKFTTYEVQGGGEPSLSCNDKTHVLTELHHRSIFRYLPQGELNIFGSFAGFRPKPRSRVSDTPLTQEFLEYYGVEQGFDKPQMGGWRPWRNNVLPMVEHKQLIDNIELEKCVESFTNDIIGQLPTDWEKELMFLSDLASVNGLPGVIYVDKLNTNTSMGFPWNESKKKHLEPFVTEMYPQGVNFNEEIWTRVSKIKEIYAKGRRAYPVFMGHLKDEATPLEKCKIGKTRLFTGAPVDWSLVVRSRLLTFVRLVQKNKFAFEAAPGTVCQSSEWGKIRNYLTQHGEDMIVAGDYSKFDKRMSAQFVLAAFKVICNIFKRAGFPDHEIREIACIGEDIAYPIVNVNGCLVEFFGTNPSGHPLTVIVNSFVNSLYMRYPYYKLNPLKELINFSKDVALITYGDDNAMGVSKRVPWFNHTSIQKVLKSIGVEYTMADKESESIPYIHIDECSFLKRKWIFSKELNEWLCPLEEKSIIKSLTKWVPSKTLDEHAQMVAIISSANSEYFFHGREIFEKHHTKFKEILLREPYSFYVQESTLPQWHELKARFEAASENCSL